MKKQLQQKKLLKKRKISSSDLIPIGKFGKTHGLHGELKFISFCDPIENILLYKEFFLKLDQTISLEFKLTGTNLIVKIHNIDRIDQAKSYVNQEIYVTKQELKSFDNESMYWTDLIGSVVINTAGNNLGKVIKIENHGASDLLFVKGDNYEEVIPITDEFFINFDNENKIIEVEWEQL